MNKVFLICFVAFSITCQAEVVEKTVLQDLQGVWEGTGIQDDNSRWTIKVTIEPDEYSIDYPSLNCGGMMRLMKENADSLVFQEVLTYGTDRCYNNGKTVLIKSQNNKIRYYWYFENNGRKAAFGELSRQNYPLMRD
jgi:hypothetical protein